MSTDQLNFDISKTTALTCKCGNQTFVQAVLLREVSALLSPNGKKGIIPVPTFVCNGCGAVPAEVVPGFLKEEAKSQQTSTETSGEKITKGNLTLL